MALFFIISIGPIEFTLKIIGNLSHFHVNCVSCWINQNAMSRLTIVFLYFHLTYNGIYSTIQIKVGWEL